MCTSEIKFLTTLSVQIAEFLNFFCISFFFFSNSTLSPNNLVAVRRQIRKSSFDVAAQQDEDEEQDQGGRQGSTQSHRETPRVCAVPHHELLLERWDGYSSTSRWHDLL